MPLNAEPQVTVLMSVHNGEEYLREAIESILNQTLADFEFLLVDDGSTDGSASILAECAAKDARISILRNERNLGLAASLNRGLELARAPLIARMDADDASLPHRLETQVRFMAEHPEVTVCGSFFEGYENGETVRMPEGHDLLSLLLLFHNNPMAHPTVILRKNVIMQAGGYDSECHASQDYRLWAHLSLLPGICFANIPDVLLRYRQHPEKERTSFRARQERSAEETLRGLLQSAFGFSELKIHWNAHKRLCFPSGAYTLGDVMRSLFWLLALLFANKTKNIYAHGLLRKELWNRFTTMARAAVRNHTPL